MAYISIFKVSQDGKELQLTMQPTSGETFSSLLLWTQDTYKDYSQAIDLTSLISTTSTVSQSIVIADSDIGESFLAGIYFVEITDTSDPAGLCDSCSNVELGVATDLARFSYCLAQYLCDIDLSCANCSPNLSTALTMKMYIDSLRDSLQLGNFITAIDFWVNLDRFCDGECVECGTDLSELARRGLGFQTLGNELILY